MIQKIVDEIHNEKYTMKHLESVQAIDFETIVIIGGTTDWEIQDILKHHKYHIYKTNEYKIIDGEVCDEETIYLKQREIRDKSEDHESGYREFMEWLEPHKTITEIKIEPNQFYLQKMYKKWKEEQNEAEELRVKDLIKRLQKTDQNAFVVVEDQEWGGYYSLYQSDEPMKVTTTRDCPDCNRGCCSRCPDREMFERKMVVF